MNVKVAPEGMVTGLDTQNKLPLEGDDQNSQTSELAHKGKACMHPQEYCLICGHALVPQTPRRFKSAADMLQFVKTSCHPTRFAYAYITRALSDPTRVEDMPMCTACGNWCKRASALASRKFLPIDDVLCFVENVGNNPPDKRTLIRVLKSLSMEFVDAAGVARPANVYRTFSTPAVDILVRSLAADFFTGCQVSKAQEGVLMVDYFGREVATLEKDSIVHEIVRTNWLVNGMPMVLQNAQTARLVRKVLSKPYGRARGMEERICKDFGLKE